VNAIKSFSDVDVQIHSYSNSALEGGGGRIHARPALPSEKEFILPTG